MRKVNNIFLIAPVIICLASLSWTVSAARQTPVHRFHTSLTRIDYNAEQKLFEVSIQLFTHDLAPLLEKETRSRIDLEKTNDVDKLILNYLNQNFILIDKKGEAKKFKWVGKELDADAVWIYLEATSNESAEGYTLQNTIFFESFPEQTNIVVCRFEEKKADMIFKTGDKVKEIIVSKPKEEN
jgi:hypothetical protein